MWLWSLSFIYSWFIFQQFWSVPFTGYVTVFNPIFCSQFLLLQTGLQWITSYIEHMHCNLQNVAQNEAGQRIIEFCQENALVIANTSSKNTREDSTHGHHQMVNIKIRLIIFLAAKDREALYSQQKQDQEQTAVRSWPPYCQIQASTEENRENH